MHTKNTLLWGRLLSFLLLWNGLVLYSYAQESTETDTDIQRRSNSPGKIMPYGANTSRPANSIAVNRKAEYQNLSPEDLIKEIFVRTGSCTSIENVQVQVYNWNNNTKAWTSGSTGPRGLAYFETPADADFPMKNGLILSTGDVREAEGSNKSDAAMGGGITTISVKDVDLQSIISKQGNYFLTNYTVLEFDFVPTGTKMEFKYIFASEEYPEYVESPYNDVFGFFISEYNSQTSVLENKRNIALLPTTTNPGIHEVSINNVNNGYFTSNYYNGTGVRKISNPGYFIPNKGGNLATEFDGYTVVLTAKADLEACKKYHLKIAIGNAGDIALGSGVFLQSNSFEAGDDIVNVVNGVSDVYNAFLDCPDNQYKLIAKISNVSDQATTVQLEFSGTAVNGTDFVDMNGNPLKNSYVVPVGQSQIEIPYKLTSSASVGKKFNVKLFCPCSGGTTAAKRTITFTNKVTGMTLTPMSVCSSSAKGSISVQMTGTSNDYEYSIDGGATWVTSSVFENLSVGTYTISGRDRGGCATYTQTTKIEHIVADAGVDQVQCGEPDFTIIASPLKSNETGTWSFVGTVPAGTAIENPSLATTKVKGVPEGATVTVKWTLSNGSCSTNSSITLSNQESVDKYETIRKDIFIENLAENNALKLLELCGSVPANPAWSVVIADGYFQFDASTGTVTYDKSKLYPSLDVFRYAVTDACGNRKYCGIYLNVVSGNKNKND